MIKSLTKSDRITLSIIILLVALMTLFFGNRKVGYYLDELWTYGLANNIGSTQPDIEFGKEYYEMGPYKDFFEVKSGEGFNYVNVWQNQANDVHPPLYYVFVHTICSFFPDTFSKWYGIAVNIFWMVGISILLYKLGKEITSSTVASAGMVLAYETSLIFMNTLMFIRMYTQVTFFVIAFAYLIKKYWDDMLDRKFYSWFAVIVILGMMTHYYFIIIAFALCVSLAIHLIVEKRLAELRASIIVAIGTGVLYLLCWYHFLGHLFRGYRGKEAINAALSLGGLADGVVKMFTIINIDAFAGAMVVYAIVLVAIIVIKCRKKEKLLNYEAALFLCALFYIIVVGKIAPFREDRYIMPVVFALFISFYLAVRYIVKLFWKDTRFELLVICLFMTLNLYNFARNGFYANKDYYNAEKIEFMNDLHGQNCIVYIDDLWESLYYYSAMQHTGTYTFVNGENVEEVLNEQNDSYFLVSAPSKVKTIVEKLNATEKYSRGWDTYFWVVQNH